MCRPLQIQVFSSTLILLLPLTLLLLTFSSSAFNLCLSSYEPFLHISGHRRAHIPLMFPDFPPLLCLAALCTCSAPFNYSALASSSSLCSLSHCLDDASLPHSVNFSPRHPDIPSFPYVEFPPLYSQLAEVKVLFIVKRRKCRTVPQNRSTSYSV